MSGAVLQLSVLTPEQEFFSGEVEGVSVTLPDGELCILAGHAPLVAPLMAGSFKIKQHGVWREAFAAEGHIEVGREHTYVFAQACEWQEDIDVSRAKQAAERAEELIRQRRSIHEYKNSQITLARAMARLRITNHRTGY